MLGVRVLDSAKIYPHAESCLHPSFRDNLQYKLGEVLLAPLLLLWTPFHVVIKELGSTSLEGRAESSISPRSLTLPQNPLFAPGGRCFIPERWIWCLHGTPFYRKYCEEL